MSESISRLVLASASPTRAHLLQAAGLSFETIPANVDEDALKELSSDPASDVEAGDIALLLAQTKAVTVSQQYPDAMVIGADQTLLLDERLLDKPADKDEAREQLLLLKGRTHSLDTATACARHGAVIWTSNDRAYLTIRDFSSEALGRYLAAAGDDVTASVGGYKIEGPAIQLFSRIEGDFFSILGLCLLPLLEFLREQRVIVT